MKYKAIIFDMDGTLLNTIDDIYDCVCMFLEKYSYPARSLDEVKAAMGGGAHNLVKMVLPKDVSKEEYDTFFNDYCPYYESHGKDKTGPYPGVMQLLYDLKSAGVKTAVVSSKPHRAVLQLNKEYFDDIFDISIGDDFKRKLKPAPDGIYAALEELGIAKENAIYVGDSEYDILAAKNAEMDGVAVSWGYRKRSDLEKLNPMYLADNIDELRRIIL